VTDPSVPGLGPTTGAFTAEKHDPPHVSSGWGEAPLVDLHVRESAMELLCPGIQHRRIGVQADPLGQDSGKVRLGRRVGGGSLTRRPPQIRT